MFEKIKELELKDLEMIRYFIIFIIVADIFGIWWYLGWKSLGSAILISAFLFLALVLILERRKRNKMMDKEEEYFDDEDFDEYEEDKQIDYDLGVPSADEYEERLKDAISMI